MPYELKASPIGGRGLFAVEDIPAGALIWKYLPNVNIAEHDEAALTAKLEAMESDDERQHFLTHVYPWEGKAVEILDDGQYWNHSATPNTGETGTGDEASHTFAIRDIKAGEELTDDYAQYQDLPWMTALSQRYGLSGTVRQWAENLQA